MKKMKENSLQIHPERNLEEIARSIKGTDVLKALRALADKGAILGATALLFHSIGLVQLRLQYLDPKELVPWDRIERLPITGLIEDLLKSSDYYRQATLLELLRDLERVYSLMGQVGSLRELAIKSLTPLFPISDVLAEKIAMLAILFRISAYSKRRLLKTMNLLDTEGFDRYPDEFYLKIPENYTRSFYYSLTNRKKAVSEVIVCKDFYVQNSSPTDLYVFSIGFKFGIHSVDLDEIKKTILGSKTPQDKLKEASEARDSLILLGALVADRFLSHPMPREFSLVAFAFTNQESYKYVPYLEMIFAEIILESQSKVTTERKESLLREFLKKTERRNLSGA